MTFGTPALKLTLFCILKSSANATIFNNSHIQTDFGRRTYRNCLLLEDGGYSNKTFLDPRTPAEQRYSMSQIKSRNCIERCFGILKQRFPILAYGCRLKTTTTMTIIVVAAILHNLALTMYDIKAPLVPDEINANELDRLIEIGQIPDVNKYGPIETVGVGAQLRS